MTYACEAVLFSQTDAGTMIPLERRRKLLTKVRVRPDEPFDKALRRFKKKCNKDGLMQRLKELRHYEKPSDRRRRKLAKAMSRQATNKPEF